MNRILYNVLNDVNEGIVILDDKLQICLWNKYMECITGISNEKAIKSSIYDILPNFNANYIINAINDVASHGCKVFFSAAMHKGLIDNRKNLNVKISRIVTGKSKFILLEFIDVTNKVIQINKLRNYVQELYKVNKELKEKEEIIQKLAYYDKLTGVANRTLFYKLAEELMYNAKRDNTLLALMFIDIDKFKNINDTYGHIAGDRIIVKVAELLKEAVRKNDIVARYGGDEFLILLPCIKDINNYKHIVSRITDDNNKVIDYNGNKINISLSMGISFYPHDGNSIDNLIAAADKAMYAAKYRDGDNNCLSSFLIKSSC